MAAACAGTRSRPHRSTPTPAGVVAAMHAAHAQIMSAAELSVGLRLPGSTRGRRPVGVGRPRAHQDLRSARHGARGPDARPGDLDRCARVDPPDPQPVRGRRAAVRGADRRGGRGDRRRPPRPATSRSRSWTRAVVERTGPWAGDLVMPAFQTFWPRWRQAVSRRRPGRATWSSGRAGAARSPTPAPGSVRPDVRAGPSRPGACRSSCAATCTPTGPPLRRTWPGGWARRSTGPRPPSRPPTSSPCTSIGVEAWVNAGDTIRSRGARRGAPAPLLRRARRRLLAPREMLYPGRAGDAGAGPWPGRQLPGGARRRGGPWRLAPAAVGSPGARDRRDLGASSASARLRELESRVARVGEVLEAEADLTLRAGDGRRARLTVSG